MLKTVTAGISAGVLISIGGSVFLACPDNRYFGAIFFSVALLSICYLGYYLYTGKIAYVVSDHSGKNCATLGVGLLANLVTTYLLGLLVRWAIPSLGERAEAVCDAKLAEGFGSCLVRAFFCGILMYLAVEIFREKKTPIGILFGIPVFILAGFEHSIADMFYFGCAACVKPDFLLFELGAVLGNSLGSVLLPLLALLGAFQAKKKDPAPETVKTPEEGEMSDEG